MDFQKLLLDVGKALRKDEVKALAFLCTDLLGRNPNSVEMASDLFSRLADQDHLSAERPYLLTELLLIIQRTRLIRDFQLFDPASTTGSLISPYRKLLYDLSEDITDEDLKSVKFLLNKELPRRKLEDNVSTLEVFLEMEHMDLISDTNLHLLETIIQSVCPMLRDKINQFKALQAHTSPAAQETGRSRSMSNPSNPAPQSFTPERTFSFEIPEDFKPLEESPMNTSNTSMDLPIVFHGGDECGAPSLGLSDLNTGISSVKSMTIDFLELPSQENKASSEKQTSQTTNTNTEALNGSAPSYLTDCFSEHVPNRYLRSSSAGLLNVPKMTYKQYGEAAFCCYAPKVLGTYPMTAAKRGICLIVNNNGFTKSSGLKERMGTMMDKECLQKVFTWLGFEVDVRSDCKRKDILSAFRELGSRDHSQVDCLVCCVLSHGQEGVVYGVDGLTVKIEELKEPVNGVKCASLAEKPKLFFIQACQGTGAQKPVHIEADGPARSPVCSDAVRSESIPSDADFLLAMATVPSFVSYRERTNGTWFIQSLCHNLVKMVPRGCDLVSILTKVNADVSQKTDSSGVKKQMPQPAFSLRKKVVFPIPEAPPPSLSH